jgi:hypothetical protein
MSSLAEDMSDHRWRRGTGVRVVIPVLLLGAAAAFLLARRWRGVMLRDEDPDEDPLLEPPPRYLQDAVPVDGEAAIHPPPGTELIQRSRVQG